MNAQQTIDTIIQQGCLPLYYNADASVSIAVLQALYNAGIKAVEYTNRGEAAFENFKKLKAICNSEMKDLLLGIGTIKNEKEATRYIDAGADFLISPGLVLEVAALANSVNMLYAPGCMTPTEIIAAENAGLQFIKLFPGDMLAPKYVNTIKDIFPNLFFMATGGVDITKENIQSWFKAGVCAVGMGSKLISKQLMTDKNYSAIEQATKEVLQIIQLAKNNK